MNSISLTKKKINNFIFLKKLIKEDFLCFMLNLTSAKIILNSSYLSKSIITYLNLTFLIPVNGIQALKMLGQRDLMEFLNRRKIGKNKDIILGFKIKNFYYKVQSLSSASLVIAAPQVPLLVRNLSIKVLLIIKKVINK